MNGAALLVAAMLIAPAAAQFTPPAGYSGGGHRPGVAADPEPGSPALTRLSDAALQPLFRIDPAYPRASQAGVKVVGAYAIAEAAGARLTDAWSPGFLPVTLVFGDGRCFTLTSAYENGTLADGRLAATACRAKPHYDRETPPTAPAGYRALGVPWGFGVWRDEKAGTTVIGAPHATSFRPLVAARMAAVAAMAMNSPDAPLANLTLVGRVKGRLVVVTLELAY